MDKLIIYHDNIWDLYYYESHIDQRLYVYTTIKDLLHCIDNPTLEDLSSYGNAEYLLWEDRDNITILDLGKLEIAKVLYG